MQVSTVCLFTRMHILQLVALHLAALLTLLDILHTEAVPLQDFYINNGKRTSKLDDANMPSISLNPPFKFLTETLDTAYVSSRHRHYICDRIITGRYYVPDHPNDHSIDGISIMS